MIQKINFNDCVAIRGMGRVDEICNSEKQNASSHTVADYADSAKDLPIE